MPKRGVCKQQQPQRLGNKPAIKPVYLRHHSFLLGKQTILF